MGITGKQVAIGIQIVKLAHEAKNMPTNVNSIIDHAKLAAAMIVPSNLKESVALSNAIINTMITIKAEVQ